MYSYNCAIIGVMTTGYRSTRLWLKTIYHGSVVWVRVSHSGSVSAGSENPAIATAADRVEAPGAAEERLRGVRGDRSSVGAETGKVGGTGY